MASAPSQQLPPGNGDLEGFWDSLGGQPACLLPQLPCPYPALPCYSWLPPLHLSLFTQPVPAPFELLPAAPRLWWPGGPALPSPLARPGPWASPSAPRAKPASASASASASAASSSSSSRESTAALKAWLARHAKNPYPSKGEKVLLALVSGMSLAQVSTWFANARRRLKKENRACWGGRPPKAAAGGPEQQDDDDDDDDQEDSEGGGAAAAAVPAPSALQPSPEPPQGPRAAPGLEAAAAGRGRPSSPGAGPARAPGPKIWRVAELATSPQRRPAAF